MPVLRTMLIVFGLAGLLAQAPDARGDVALERTKVSGSSASVITP